MAKLLCKFFSPKAPDNSHLRVSYVLLLHTQQINFNLEVGLCFYGYPCEKRGCTLYDLDTTNCFIEISFFKKNKFPFSSISSTFPTVPDIPTTVLIPFPHDFFILSLSGLIKPNPRTFSVSLFLLYTQAFLHFA